jgi:hypothetical protein
MPRKGAQVCWHFPGVASRRISGKAHDVVQFQTRNRSAKMCAIRAAVPAVELLFLE